MKTHRGEKLNKCKFRTLLKHTVEKSQMICPYEEVVIGIGRVTIINNILRTL